MEQYTKKSKLLKIENTLCMRCRYQGCLLFYGGCPTLISISESKQNQNTEEDDHETV